MFCKCRNIQLFGRRAAIIVALLICCFLTLTAGDEPTTTTRIRNLPKITKSRAVVTERAKTTTTTTTTTTEPAIEETTTAGINDICIHGITAVTGDSEEEQTVVKTESDFVQIIEGEIMLSVITTDAISAMFVINRLNVANLLEADFEIGVRTITIDADHLVENLLLQEVEYQQQCITHAMGIFIDFDYYNVLEAVIRELDYNIWPIPSTRADIFPKVAHLLYQMPWGDQIASVEILTENLNIYNDFMDAVRSERMCLMHFKSDANIYILFGNKMASHFKENGTVFAVPTERMDRHFIIDLPNKSFILMENEIDLHLVDKNSTQITLDEPLVGKTILPSRVLAFARPILELSRWLKYSLQKNCQRLKDNFVIETCVNFLAFIEDWEKSEYHLAKHNTAELLDLLRMRHLAPLMNFQMFQKFVDETRPGAAPGPLEFEEKITNLKEIASQNFVTNITTYYHYNRDNHTSVELKTKFGHVFNCQYTAGGDNSRYPFLFDGESVMFWRIKPDTWVATGMTAAILGILCTLAILVFIVVRISLGDVFEGNPVTSILLLLSLLLMFTSFIPFSLEYVGEHRNSHVTFEDAATLNTLCAVRIFILTLVYCFVFSLLLCRAVMLASIGSEGGFLSHVNGYIQAVICVFSIMVQLVMSIQLLVVMHIASDKISCENMYYGHWLLGLLSYDMLLLLSIIALVPFIYRSQRNYREGILIVIGAVLMFIIWIVFIALSMFGDEMRDAALPLGLQASGWAILVGILIPRTFLIVRGIERSDIAQALPSLTSLAFAQNNQYSSEQSVYECVNPAMRNMSQDELHHQTPSEIPTLPLRGGGPRRQQFFANLRQANANIGPNRQSTTRVQRGSPNQSEQSSLEEDEDSPENKQLTPSKAFLNNLPLHAASATKQQTTVANHLSKRCSKDEQHVLGPDYKQQLFATTTNCQRSASTATATNNTTATTISCLGHTDATAVFSKSPKSTTNSSINTAPPATTTAAAAVSTTTKLTFNPMTKQLSSNSTPSGVGGAASGTASAAAVAAAGSVPITNGSLAATFLHTNLSPTIISPTATLTPATASTLQYSSVTGAIPKKGQLQIPSHTNNHNQNHNHNHSFHINQNTNASTQPPTNISSSLTNHNTTTTTTAQATSAALENSVTTVSTKTTTPKKSASTSSSSNDANGRSAALERAYVHDVYESCEEPTGSLRPRVAQFLSNLEAGSVVCDVGCGSGRYLTQCNPSICTVGVDRCYRLSRVAKEKGGEVALCDNLELPFRDESFDAVLSIAVVHHFATTERRVNALRELARVLRIGGRVVITVWALEQRHRRFESQDVLIPWQPPKNRNFNYSDEEDDEDFLPPYHAYTEDSTNSSRSAGDGDSSSLSSSSPGESCYSFVRRAIQKLAGGRKHAWFLDSWTSKDTKNDSSLDYEDAKDLPIELRRLEDFEDFTDPPLSAGLKSRSLGSILNPPPRQIVRSRSSVPSLGGPILHVDKNTNSTQLLDAHLAGQVVTISSSSSNAHANGHSPTNQTLNGVSNAVSAAATQQHTSSNLSRRPKLIKQKQSLCDEDYQLPDTPFHILSQYNVNTNGVTNALFAKQQSLPGQHLTTRQMRKQSSLNEELMAGNRIREKERVRKRIQKQMSLNEAFLCRSALFSKRLQVIREGFTSKIKSSTGSLERVTKTGLNKIMQNLKTTPEEKAPAAPPGVSKTPKGNICTHEHHHHHHHYYQQQQQQQQHSPLVSNFQSHLHHLLHRQNTANKFAGPVTMCKSLDCTTTACYCQAYHQACSQCTSAGDEEKARRHSRESGSDSSKDSSLQSDTSIESEDSFASVIFIPKPEQHQQQLNYQQQHQNSNSSSSNSSSSNGGGCHVHKTCCQSKCVSSASNLGQCCKLDINGHRISSVPTSPLIMPCPPTPAHSPAAAQTAVTSPPQTMPAVIAAMAMFTPPAREKISGEKLPLNGLNKTRFNFDEAHIKQQESKDHQQQQEELKQQKQQQQQQQQQKKTEIKAEIKSELERKPSEIKITRQIIKDLPPIPKFRKQQSLQITRQSFPIVRRTTTAGGGPAIATVPKLMSLELFNPATDDLDSDSSEPSSPDSVDSVISAPRSSNLTAAPSLDQAKDITPNEDKAAESDTKSDSIKETETDSSMIVNDDKSDIIPSKYDGGMQSNQPQDCQEFAEQLSAQLMRELEEKHNKAETRSLEASEEFFEDPFSQPRKRNGDKDLTALRDELRERRLMLANLSTQPSLNQSPNSSSTSSLSSQTRSFTIHEEDEDENEEENERSYTLQLYENCKISKLNYKRHLHNNLHPETAYLLQDEDSSIKDEEEEEEELEEIEHDVIIEEDEDEVEAEDTLTQTQHMQMTNNKSLTKTDSIEEEHTTTTTTKKSSSEDTTTTTTTTTTNTTNTNNTTMQNRNHSTESWEHSNSSTTSLDSPSQGGATTHHRYYHVFREGELDALINHHVASLHIVSSYYERASWCVVAEKVQVWTI